MDTVVTQFLSAMQNPLSDLYKHLVNKQQESEQKSRDSGDKKK